MKNSHSAQLTAADGHAFEAYVSSPSEGKTPSGSVVVLQEIFGVNAHIQSVADRFAELGYVAIAPSLYDRVERGAAMQVCDANDVARGRALRAASKLDHNLMDISAARAHVAGHGASAVVGYCWGGMLAWAASGSGEFEAAVVYYGGGIPQLGISPACPVLAHFGETDGLIPMSDVESLKVNYPQAEIHVYPTGHGFNCDIRDSYHKPSADLAWARTRSFLAFHLNK